ncbi:MAG: hypothetical protein V3V03_08555, partial [Hyphomonadaceae bacterium]
MCMALFGLAACGAPGDQMQANNQTAPLDAEQSIVQLIENSEVTVQVDMRADGVWRVDYVFAQPQTSLGFSRSIGDYRRATWQAMAGTPSIRREHQTDLIVFDAPAKRASFIVEPWSERLPRDYTPFVKFSDGQGAIFLDQFRVDAVTDVDSLNSQTEVDDARQTLSLGVILKSPHSILLDGIAQEGSIERLLEDGEQVYAYAGTQALEEGKSYVGVLDPGLPEHILSSFDDDLAQVFAAYEDRWGFSLPEKATVYFAYGGAERQGWSSSGSVAGQSTMVLWVHGKALLEPDEDTRRKLIWFFAHEAAHMFQGAKGKEFGSNLQAWWHEGSADAMAHDVLRELGIASDTFLQNTYRQRIDTCGVAIEERSLIGHYGKTPDICGDLVAIAANAALPDHNLYDIWNEYLGRAPEELDDDEIDTLFLETLSDLGASPNAVEAIGALIQDKQDNGRNAILSTFETVGIAYELDRYGSVISITLP